MSALNTDETTSIETSDFGFSFTYAASFSRSEFLDFVTNNIAPSGLILKSSAAVGDWSLTDQIVLRNNDENFENTAEAAESGSLSQLAGGLFSGTSSLIANGTSLRIKGDAGLEEIFNERSNAIVMETENNVKEASSFDSLMADFSTSFNNRQTERKELRREQRAAEAQGLKCSEVTSCLTQKTSFSASEKSYSRSINPKNSNGDFIFKEEQIYLGSISSGSINGDGTMVFQISGGAALNDAESYYTKKNNGQLSGNKNRQISLDTAFKAIEDKGKLKNTTRPNGGSDTTAPIIIPAALRLGANVPINTPVKITFSEPIRFSNQASKWAKAYKNVSGTVTLHQQWNAPQPLNMRIWMVLIFVLTKW